MIVIPRSLIVNIREDINRIARACSTNDNIIRNYRRNILQFLDMIVHDIMNGNINDNTIDELRNIRNGVASFQNYCLNNYDNHIIINTFSQLARNNIDRMITLVQKAN